MPRMAVTRLARQLNDKVGEMPMRKYRHRQSGAVFETDRDMPPLDWERIDQEQEHGQEQAPEQKRRSRTRRKDTSKE